MRRVVSVSLGSSKRDHKVRRNILGEEFEIERVGTDGDIKRAIALIRELDGKVDAFGMGGIDLYIQAGNRRYVLRDAIPLARAAVKTPIVDGSGLKNTLERKVVQFLAADGRVRFQDRKVLMVSAVDRFGMAEALDAAGARLLLGDLAFTLGVPVILRSLRSLDLLARVIGPVVCRLPFSMLYPTGSKQEEIKTDDKYARYYHQADIIAGDFHFIRRYLPDRVDGKVIITNTVTASDVDLLRERGARTLITTTPELEGRSFGTNVMEGVLVALSGKRPTELRPDDYEELLQRMGFQPRIEELGA